MCTGKCSSVVGAALWPFALLCIVANILLAFPNWDAQYVHDWGKHLTPEIFYLGGLVGGGIMMFISVLLAGVGVVGAAYALCVSMLGLVHGPLCRVRLQNGALSDWKRPFLIGRNVSQDSYLFAPEVWDDCEDPPGVTRFNVILFSLIASASVLELALCLIQVFNGLFGFLCGTCNEKKVAPKTYN